MLDFIFRCILMLLVFDTGNKSAASYKIGAADIILKKLNNTSVSVKTASDSNEEYTNQVLTEWFLSAEAWNQLARLAMVSDGREDSSTNLQKRETGLSIIPKTSTKRNYTSEDFTDNHLTIQTANLDDGDPLSPRERKDTGSSYYEELLNSGFPEPKRSGTEPVSFIARLLRNQTSAQNRNREEFTVPPATELTNSFKDEEKLFVTSMLGKEDAVEFILPDPEDGTELEDVGSGDDSEYNYVELYEKNDSEHSTANEGNNDAPTTTDSLSINNLYTADSEVELEETITQLNEFIPYNVIEENQTEAEVPIETKEVLYKNEVDSSVFLTTTLPVLSTTPTPTPIFFTSTNSNIFFDTTNISLRTVPFAVTLPVTFPLTTPQPITTTTETTSTTTETTSTTTETTSTTTETSSTTSETSTPSAKLTTLTDFPKTDKSTSQDPLVRVADQEGLNEDVPTSYGTTQEVTVQDSESTSADTPKLAEVKVVQLITREYAVFYVGIVLCCLGIFLGIAAVVSFCLMRRRRRRKEASPPMVEMRSSKLFEDV